MDLVNGGSLRGISFRNDSGETMPAYAVMRLTEPVIVGGKTCWPAQKPQANGQEILAINGPVPVSAGGYGETQFGDVLAGYFNDTAPFDVGDTVGPVANQWYFGGGDGWLYAGDGSNTKVGFVQRVGGGGGGEEITFRIADMVGNVTVAGQEYRAGWCTVVAKSCGSSIHGADANGRVLVIDVMGCLFSEPDEDLEPGNGHDGRMGVASWQELIGDPDHECRYVATSLCCPPLLI